LDELTTTTGIVAVAAAAVAVIAVLWLIVLTRRMAKLRAAQRVVFGEREARDLVTHAAELDRDFRSLHSYVEDLAGGLQSRLTTVEQRLDGAVTHHGLIRYDAYNEMSGRQSTSIALLDSRGSGVVVSSIHHRDQARLYAKQVVEGRGQLELSPEEHEAIRVALAGEVPDRTEQHR
jgi:uncharacterized protein DUF4446